MSVRAKSYIAMSDQCTTVKSTRLLEYFVIPKGGRRAIHSCLDHHLTGFISTATQFRKLGRGIAQCGDEFVGNLPLGSRTVVNGSVFQTARRHSRCRLQTSRHLTRIARHLRHRLIYHATSPSSKFPRHQDLISVGMPHIRPLMRRQAPGRISPLSEHIERHRSLKLTAFLWAHPDAGWNCAFAL
ncbi:hypothetical protein DFP72DRAFT_1069145 [Ephemerocybe angulata]|uniref:Uncharacterized protein n=1 Tax=Ephemerocybe angulata TaxID=980116 RepID=A0A8H6M454_9AGAR|nr:hypothetical protein DFP72DRAFT_1069145 [Tulosesus angulatus]